jgi:hypothetical protein
VQPSTCDFGVFFCYLLNTPNVQFKAVVAFQIADVSEC